MPDEIKVCGTCLYNKFDRSESFYYCGNERSDYYTDLTHYNDDCEHWEQKSTNK